MADNEGGRRAAPWGAFLSGIVIVALAGLGIAAYTGHLQRNSADLEIDLPDVKLNPPDIDLPEPPPAPQVPPSAEPAPAASATPQ
ncbi:MAG: hypothetical protein ACREH4_01040 [Vitreimonas sp.]